MKSLLSDIAIMITFKAGELHLSDLHHGLALKERFCITLGFADAGSPHDVAAQEMSLIDAWLFAILLV